MLAVMSNDTTGKKKRRARDAPISPPPPRAKVRSTTTSNAFASFFMPTSEKSAEMGSKKLIWLERSVNEDTPPSLLTAHYNKDGASGPKRRKIAAFDFDWTLIKTATGKKYASGPNDWKWWHLTVPEKLRELYNQDYQVIIISNQGGLSFKTNAKKSAKQNGMAAFKAKVSAVLSQLDIPISLYAATEKDIFRKPRPGMWKEMAEDYDLDDVDGIDLVDSFFVGDAAGREAVPGKPKDFSCSDRDLAQNIGIKFLTPEEFFLGQQARPFTRDFEPAEFLGEEVKSVVPKFPKVNKQDLVIFCGSPGAGKSTFYWKHLKPLGYERVNQDILKTREKCLKCAGDMLSKGISVAVDNTNADEAVRDIWVKLAAKYNVPVRCVLFTATLRLCEHNDVVRALNPSMNPENRSILPSMAFTGWKSRFCKPTLAEGFQDITEVKFEFDGGKSEREIWSQHWT